MNYQKIYDDLISNARKRGWTKTSAPCRIEIHHIIPKSVGGSNHPNNLVALTVREHILAHVILAKAQGGKLWRAAFGMTNGRRLKEVSSRTITLLKEKASHLISEALMGNNHGSYEWSAERLQIHIDAMRKVGFTPAKLKALEKAWAKNTGSKQSQETRDKKSKAMKGFTPVKAGDYETCSKAGKANKGVKKSFRSEDHSKNWKETHAKKYPHWLLYDELFLLWINNNKPKVTGFTKIAVEAGYPKVHYGKMVDKFIKQVEI